MLKISTLIALFICIVYSNNEHNIDKQLPPNELQVSEQPEQSEKTLESVKGYYTEQKKSRKPCRRNYNRRFNEDKSGEYESIPITATIDLGKTASSGDRFITESIHSANYNYETKDFDGDTVNTNYHTKDCGCKDCVVEGKILQFESLAISTPKDSINLNDAAKDSKTSESQSADNNNNLIYKHPLRHIESASEESSSNPIKNDVLVVRNSEPESDVKNNNLIENEALGVETINGKQTKPCIKELNGNTRRKNCGKTRRILPGIINNPTKQELEDNKLYQNIPQSDQINTRHTYYPNVHTISNSYDIDLVHNMNINDAPDQNSNDEETSVESQLTEPTKGEGIYDMKEAEVMLLENSRVCYACSTMSDPTCWSPDRRTTVKYCRKGHQSCLTKSFKHKGKAVIIRDCGSQCVNGEDSYSSCSICHSDLCNSASSISIFSTTVAVTVLCGILFNKH